jgi:hypothetical protein
MKVPSQIIGANLAGVSIRRPFPLARSPSSAVRRQEAQSQSSEFRSRNGAPLAVIAVAARLDTG